MCVCVCDHIEFMYQEISNSKYRISEDYLQILYAQITVVMITITNINND